MNHLSSEYHCQTMIKKLQEKLMLLELGTNHSDECQSVREEIRHYNDVLTYLKKFSEEENIDRIAKEIGKHGLRHIKIKLSPIIGPCLVKICIGDILDTELYTKGKVYHISSYPNEFYDGYLDIHKEIYRYEPTTYLQDLKSRLMACIKHYLPDVSIEFSL